jgi:hypothetical protein
MESGDSELSAKGRLPTTSGAAIELKSLSTCLTVQNCTVFVLPCVKITGSNSITQVKSGVPLEIRLRPGNELGAKWIIVKGGHPQSF